MCAMCFSSWRCSLRAPPASMARKAQAAGDHFVYGPPRRVLDALEAELFRITEMLFDEISAGL